MVEVGGTLAGASWEVQGLVRSWARRHGVLLNVPMSARLVMVPQCIEWKAPWPQSPTFVDADGGSFPGTAPGVETIKLDIGKLSDGRYVHIGYGQITQTVVVYLETKQDQTRREK